MAGSTGLEPAASGVTGGANGSASSRPRKIGVGSPAVWPFRWIVDACSGTSCKFLQVGRRPQHSGEKERVIELGPTTGRRPGVPDLSTTLPQAMHVDYVWVYQRQVAK